MLLRDVMGAPLADGDDVEITALAYDNRRVEPGTLFFCVPGFTRDGHDFAPDAVARGAAALVVERPLGLGVPEVVVESVRAAMAPAAARFEGDPTAQLDVVGITGTNGKTTTAFLVRALLEAAGRQCGLLGTVTSFLGGVEHPVTRTTGEAIDLQRDFRTMREGGDVACAMEVSSHALELGRADAIHWAAAIFTNLTQDHLDFHPTMEEYFLAKRRLFASGPGVAVVNVDDAYGRRLAGELEAAGCPPLTFAIERDASYRALDVETGFSGSSFTARTPEGPIALRTPLPGRFNVQNVLGAVAAVRALGVPLEAIAAALPQAGRVPGRFEPVDEGQPFAVLVDYAHTPDSLENVLRAARELTSARVHCVFGCGGDRDRGKRPQMGEIAARLADRTVVTSDNPRSEQPAAIVEEILAGIPSKVRERVTVDVDRRAAIGQALAAAQPGDVVVIAGKGHEQGQELAGGEKIPFDDVTVAREALVGAERPRLVRSWTPERVAQAAGARLAAPAPTGAGGPARVTIDSRAVAPGDLFVGLPGETHDGGRFAAQALAAGAWGVLVAPQHAGAAGAGAVLVAEDPLAALQALASAWRRELGSPVIAITGSTGKTSTKDILAALLAPHRRTFVSRGNFNTEIGLPLELLAAPADTQALVLEMGMRGAGQIAELAAIAEPDVGVIVNVGPAHLELLGSLEAIAAAKAELIAGLRAGATAVIPAGEPLLEPHRRDDVATVTFGPGGDVTLARQDGDGGVEVDAQGEQIALRLDFRQQHLRGNLLAAVAAARAIGVTPGGAVTVAFSGRRGERTRLANGITVIDDCYNANPMSMRAALDDLAATAGEGRRVAVLGDMLELGPDSARFHAEIGAHAAALGVELLVAVGPRSEAIATAFDGAGETLLAPDAAHAAALVPERLRAGDTVLVKASRGVGLEVVAEALAADIDPPTHG